MKTLKIDFLIKSNSIYPLQLDILVDCNVKYSGNLCDSIQTFSIEYDDSIPLVHEFELLLSGKRQAIDQHNATDILVSIQELKFNNIDILPLVELTSKYYHNQNGFGDDTVQDFCHDLGYDGRIYFKFTTPIASWFIAEYPF